METPDQQLRRYENLQRFDFDTFVTYAMHEAYETNAPVLAVFNGSEFRVEPDDALQPNAKSILQKRWEAGYEKVRKPSVVTSQTQVVKSSAEAVTTASRYENVRGYDFRKFAGDALKQAHETDKPMTAVFDGVEFLVLPDDSRKPNATDIVTKRYEKAYEDLKKR